MLIVALLNPFGYAETVYADKREQHGQVGPSCCLQKIDDTWLVSLHHLSIRDNLGLTTTCSWAELTQNDMLAKN